MSWYKQAKKANSAEIKMLELRVRELEDRKAFLPKWLVALNQELDNLPRQISVIKEHINQIRNG
jgi:uncharacterized coiled-coil protein SlyX